MNRRQRRKQFKKVFGMDPEQYEKWVREHWPEILAEKTKASAETLRDGFMILAEEVRKGVERISKDIDAWGEEIRVAAGFIETDNMLRKASPIPKGLDQNLLKHIGIRMDRYGDVYDFYFDETNEKYFIEILQEGEKNDGTDGIDS